MTRKYRPLAKYLALALVTAGVAAPAASARVNLNAPFSQSAAATQVVTSPPQTVTVVKSSGFDWGDAGIGAGTVVAVVLAGLGARLTIGHRRQIHATAARSSISAA
jgi:hypothetical protein